MANHGFDSAKLNANLDRLLSGWVDEGLQPSVRAFVSRHGETAYDKAFGWSNKEAQTPLGEDSIFRIYSMSKVFTSVAMLMLLEEGRYKMGDPLSKYLPAFKHSKVVEYDAAGHPNIVPAKREILIHDLFTMASGLPYSDEETISGRAMGAVMDEAIKKYKETGKFDYNAAIEALAQVPLTAHPGEHFWYGFSIDILGFLVSALSGQTLGEFMKERIFDPLDLQDTGFTVPESKLNRFVSIYSIDEQGAFTPIAKENDGNYYYPNGFESGGGGLVSTARDVGRFAQMLLNFGKFEGKRLLSRKSVELMRMNHLNAQQMEDYNWDTQRGYSYGLAVRTMLDPAKAGYGSVGEFAWDGAAGTWFLVDPSEDLICVFLVQTMPGRHFDFVPLFAQTVYGAIDD